MGAEDQSFLFLKCNKYIRELWWRAARVLETLLSAPLDVGTLRTPTTWGWVGGIGVR